jgi:hypothetical protein
VFLPRSIPIVAMVVGGAQVDDMGVLLCVA